MVLPFVGTAMVKTGTVMVLTGNYFHRMGAELAMNSALMPVLKMINPSRESHPFRIVDLLFAG